MKTMKKKLKVLSIFKTGSEAETLKLAMLFGQRIKGGQIISLKGMIGAGKTVFAKGLAKALKCEESPISASFGLMRSYKGGRLVLNHFDLFRLEDEEVPYLGIEEYIGSEDALAVFEWGSPASYLYERGELIKIFIDLDKGDKRKIIVSAEGGKSKELVLKVDGLWRKRK